MPLAPEAEAAAPSADWSSDDEVRPPTLSELSYNSQHAQLFAEPLNLKRPVPKPVRGAQADEPGATKVFLSDVYAIPKRRLFLGREWSTNDLIYAGFMTAMHALALAAPWTFSWPMAALFLGSYLVTGCLGITLSFHRQLSHRSFATPKWVEYALAYCGVLAVQGDPLEWVSSHRYHHLHCDTPLDPHSPYEGFWWSHMGWLLDHGATIERVHDRSNAADMAKDPFYAHLAKWYGLHVAAQLGALFALGGLPALVWGGALRIVWVYHITWFVNSAAHVWGTQPYNTGDLSRNNWWVAVLAFGEGWHNNHHAFEFSARHGLEWWQIDATWQCVRLLHALGLATNVKLPTEKQKARLAVAPA
jgi:stearoyl-CoA desaturase (delta-9 desaturase)